MIEPLFFLHNLMIIINKFNSILFIEEELSMLKNAILSTKKSIGKTILLFILMCLIANLVIAGLSIKSATSKSMDSVRKSLGSDVTLSYNMKNIMENREQGESMDSVMKNITVEMADSLKNLNYVESYNYTVSVSVSSDDIDPVSMQEEEDTVTFSNKNGFMDQNDFTVSGNTTMANLSDFVDENYVLTSGRLLNEDDEETKNCVIESSLASDNDLVVGDTFEVIATHEDDYEVTVTLTVVGIYEIETSDEMGNMMSMSNRQNPMNTIYTSLNVAQTLNDSTTNITSATYYLDDPDHIEAFKELAESETDIDFETYTLDANDQIYQRSISSLENMESFATMFLIVVIVAGSAILCLILVLTMRGRFYEFGVMLSLGQSKLKIIGQQLLEVGLIATLAFAVSLGTGKMVSNIVSSMLVSTASHAPSMEIDGNVKEKTGADMPGIGEGGKGFGRDLMDRAMTSPVSTELDVSLTSETVVQLAEISFAICVVSVILPSLYVLRLSPREILIKREG